MICPLCELDVEVQQGYFCPDGWRCLNPDCDFVGEFFVFERLEDFEKRMEEIQDGK